jgi:nucleotidyltransferase substrate binding protein (TIGR01987 family)
MSNDIRWIQRFNNLKNAFENLKSAIELSKKRDLSELEKQGLIQAFEFTFELSWKVIKDYLQYMNVDAKFPREAIKEGFRYELIDDGDIWIDMLEKRNLMAHTYDEEKSKLAFNLITKQCYVKRRKMKMNNFGISSKSWEILLNAIKSFHEIEKAVIFGSRAKGDYKKGSDIDIAIYGKNVDSGIALSLSAKLNEDKPTPYFYDIVAGDTIDNFDLKEHIERVGKIFFEK